MCAACVRWMPVSLCSFSPPLVGKTLKTDEYTRSKNTNKRSVVSFRRYPSYLTCSFIFRYTRLNFGGSWSLYRFWEYTLTRIHVVVHMPCYPDATAFISMIEPAFLHSIVSIRFRWSFTCTKSTSFWSVFLSNKIPLDDVVKLCVPASRPRPIMLFLSYTTSSLISGMFVGFYFSNRNFRRITLLSHLIFTSRSWRSTKVRLYISANHMNHQFIDLDDMRMLISLHLHCKLRRWFKSNFFPKRCVPFFKKQH